MLDTNIVSLLLRQHPAVTRNVVAAPMAALSISAITAGELLFGLARRPAAQRLHAAVREFLRRVEVLPWETATAARYGTMRAELERAGKVLAPLDLLIAAHALDRPAILVTNDRAFGMVERLDIADWSSEATPH